MPFYEITLATRMDTFGAVYTHGMALSESIVPQEVWPIYFVSLPSAGIFCPSSGMILLTEQARETVCERFPSLVATPVQDIHCLNWTWDEWVGSYGLPRPDGVDPRDFIEGSEWLEELLKDGTGRTQEIKLWRLELKIGAHVRRVKMPCWTHELEIEISSWNGDAIFLDESRLGVFATEEFKEVASSFDGGELIWRKVDRVI